ncbi:MAG: PrpR N-terminal domain-containing protein [Lachnospiraceae bacterium]|nr:PrpR N-terminal domain-containing protein [Lachnospiraceae bacterium]
MQKYKILGIAPYEGFKGYFLNAIAGRSDIDADIYSATLSNAVDLVKTLDLSVYDVIICRGRTGNMIKDAVDIPVVFVDFSGYDILRSIRLAQNSPYKKFAFISFSDIAKNVRLLSELAGFSMDIVTPPSPHTAEEMEELVLKLYNEGIQLFIGDGTLNECAKNIGAESILVTSGPESMEKAIDEAVEICKAKNLSSGKNLFYKSIIENISLPIAIYNSNKILIYSNLYSDKNNADLQPRLKKYVPRVLASNHFKAFETTGGNTFKIKGEAVFDALDEKYALFYVTYILPENYNNSKIYSIVDYENAKNCLTLISSSTSLSNIWDSAKNFEDSKIPMLIYGDSGTGKKTFAYALYAESKYKNNPLISIDCPKADNTSFSRLFKNDSSPLFENDCMIIFENINSLSLSLQNKLYYYIKSSALTSRNKVVSTFSGNINKMISGNLFSKELYHALSGVPVSIPSLDHRALDIPQIAGTALGEINRELPVQIVGLEPKAMELLQSHTWEYGISQLKLVLRQIATITQTQLITEENVRRFLPYPPINIEGSHLEAYKIDFSKTLDEISKDIISIVLKDEGNNQSNTAKRLGISRSTLWKKLNS